MYVSTEQLIKEILQVLLLGDILLECQKLHTMTTDRALWLSAYCNL